MGNMQPAFETLPPTRESAEAAGLKRFFPAKPCKRGHVTDRYTRDGKCCECDRERLRRRCADKPDWKSAAGRRDYEKRKEHVKAKVQAKRDADPEANRAAVKAWKQANPDGKRAHDHARRARARAGGGKHTQADINRLYAEQEGRCKVCASDFFETGYHVDHVVPLAAGGSNGPENLQLLCPTCNVRKGAKPFGEFLMEYMF